MSTTWWVCFPAKLFLLLQGSIPLCLYKCLTEQMNLMVEAIDLLFIKKARQVTEDDLNVRRLLSSSVFNSKSKFCFY